MAASSWGYSWFMLAEVFLNYPRTMSQALFESVSIMLASSWTWNILNNNYTNNFFSFLSFLQITTDFGLLSQNKIFFGLGGEFNTYFHGKLYFCEENYLWKVGRHIFSEQQNTHVFKMKAKIRTS